MSPTKRRLIITLVTLLLVALVPAAVLAAGGAFTDDDDSIFEADIEWMASSGVTAGCNPPDNDNYCPDSYVNRGQMAAFMHRFAQYLGAEDGTPAQADHATTADSATDAGTVDGVNAIELQPSIFAFDGNNDLSVLGAGDYELATVEVTVDDAPICTFGFPGADILVRASGAVTGLSSGESATFWIEDDSGMIDGTVRWIGEPWGSFAVEWLYVSGGGTEEFKLMLDEPSAHTYDVRDAQLTAEVIQNTRCEFPIIIIPSEPAGESDPAAASTD